MLMAKTMFNDGGDDDDDDDDDDGDGDGDGEDDDDDYDDTRSDSASIGEIDGHFEVEAFTILMTMIADLSMVGDCKDDHNHTETAC